MRQNFKQKLIKASVLAAALAALPAGVNAAGLGKLTVLSALGQPLRAELDLTATREELSSLSARVASAEAFKLAGIEYQSAVVGIRFSLDKRPNGTPFFRLVSDRPVNDPFLDVLIELNWASGRLVREYTFLLDPPESLQRPAPAPVAVPEKAPAAPAAPVAQPAPAPAAKAPEPRPLPAAEEKKPAEGATRAVKKGDTLAKIAGETKPEGVSLDQMLVALFKGNKDAFEGNNMNRLKAGRILNVPDATTAAESKPDEARKVVQTHAADFNAYRRKLADVAAGGEAPKEAAPRQEVAGKITPKVEDKAPAPAPGKDKLEVSRTELAKDAKDAKAVQGRVAALEEDLVARDKALKEANSRIADLEKNLADLKKLAELKSQGGAELQKQAQAAKPPAPAAAPPAPAPVAPAPAAKAQEPAAPPKAPEKPVEAAKPAEPPKAAEAPKAPEPPKAAEAPKAPEAPKAAEPAPAPAPEAAKPAEAPKPPPPPVKKPAAPPPPPPPEPSFVEDNPEIVFGGGAVVALLAGYFGYNAWRKKKKGGGVTEGDLSANSVFGTTGGQSVDTSNNSIQTDFSQSGIGAIDADEGVDPVAEADVYMAYGRDAQAEEILLDALKSDPARHAVHLKLLEIYAARKSVKQFETLATDLYGQTDGNGPDWEKAASLGRSVDPDNPLYGGKPGEKAMPDLNTTVILSAPAEKVKDTVTMPGELQQLAQAAEMPMAEIPAPAPEVPAAEEAAASLDFDLDLGSPVAEAAPAPAAAPEIPPQAPAAAEPDEAAGLDFDLDLGATVVVPAAKPAVAEPDFSGTSTVVMPEQPAAAPAEAEPSLDIDFAVTDTGIPAAKAVEEPKPADDGNVIDFDLDLSPAAAPADEVASIELERSNVMGEKALDFNFDLDSAGPEATPGEAKMPALEIPDISLDLGEPEPATPPSGEASAEENPEVATKLELAQAYEEMDDKEGARELLQEVLNEGTPAQQEAARERLARLG